MAQLSLGFFSFFWHYCPCCTRASSCSEASQQNILFIAWGFQTHAQPPTWRTRIYLFVWFITFDLSDRGDPTSSYATTSVALRIIWPRKPHHYIKVGIPSGVSEVRFVNIIMQNSREPASLRWVAESTPSNLITKERWGTGVRKVAGFLFISYYNQLMHNNLIKLYTKIVFYVIYILLHVSTFSCHPQGVTTNALLTPRWWH
jgi:hypothetical protein